MRKGTHAACITVTTADAQRGSELPSPRDATSWLENLAKRDIGLDRWLALALSPPRHAGAHPAVLTRRATCTSAAATAVGIAVRSQSAPPTM